MEAETTTHRQPILEKAWQRHAELDTNASGLNKRYINLRKWVAILGIVATFIAIFSDVFADEMNVQTAALLKVVLIATPLIASGISAFTSREMGDGRWLAMRAGAEEIAKEIYIYRTVLKHSPDRNKYLSNRLAVILRQVYKSSSNKLDTDPYKGDIPINYDPNNPDSDPGFDDLGPEDYMRFRLLDQLHWHEGRLVRLRRQKGLLTIAILIAGALGALLAGVGGPFAVWVALTASITTALTGWEELRNRESTIANYSKVKLELGILRDHWYGLRPEEQTDAEFYRLVLATEELLWMQNAEYIRAMQEALASYEDEDKKLVEDVVRKSESMHRELQATLYAETADVLDHTTAELTTVIEDAGDSVEGMVTAVSQEATAYTDTAATVVDTAVDESAAVRTHVEATVSAEIDAYGDAAGDAIDSAAAESARVRATAADAAAAETAAWGETATDAIDTAATQSAAARDLAGAEVDAWEETSQEVLADAAQTAAAARAAAKAEADAWQGAAEDAIDDAAAESAQVRDAAASAAAAESAAWGETATDAIDTAAAQSAAARAAAYTEADAWGETAADAIDTAAAESAALRETAQEGVDDAAAESAAWRETVDEAVDTAVAESARLRETADTTVKFAVSFTPVIDAAEDLVEDAQETIQDVIYQATPDVKYPISLTPPEQGEAVSGLAASAGGDDVDETVNRILEAGLNVEDSTIKEALAKATKPKKSKDS